MTRGMALLGVLALTGCSACATARPEVTRALPVPTEIYPPIVTDPDASVTLLGEGADASGCPIGPNVIITAAHVVQHGALIWKSGDREGATAVVKIDGSRDLAWLETTERLPAWLPIETRAPVAGEIVGVFGEIVNQRTLFVGRVLVVEREYGRLLLDGMAFPGSSGGCIVSARGMVYGVMQGGMNWPAHPQVRPVAYGYPIWKAAP